MLGHFWALRLASSLLSGRIRLSVSRLGRDLWIIASCGLRLHYDIKCKIIYISNFNLATSYGPYFHVPWEVSSMCRKTPALMHIPHWFLVVRSRLGFHFSCLKEDKAAGFHIKSTHDLRLILEKNTYAPTQENALLKHSSSKITFQY